MPRQRFSGERQFRVDERHDAIHPPIPAAHENPLAMRAVAAYYDLTDMKILLIGGMVASVACAQGVQNNDFSMTFGPAFASSTITNGSPVTQGTTSGPAFSLQTNYGYEFASTKAGNFYVEVADTIVSDPGITAPGVSVSNRNSYYITPGVRLKIPTGTRLSFYVATGVGAADFHEFDEFFGPQPTSRTISTWHLAFDFGGGIDFRISRWLSLRADARDYVSGAGLGGSIGHNHAVVGFGVAIHR
jgi:hypothetical protein